MRRRRGIRTLVFFREKGQTMRTFDYRHLPKGIVKGAVGDANARLYEDRGKLQVLKRLHPERLEDLRAGAHGDNVDASTRIEGLYVDPLRVHAVIEGAEPADELEAQIAGYSQALRLIEDDADSLDLSTATIVKLYETLFAHHDLGKKSRYRKKDYIYVQVEGRPQPMPVSPITAFETPLVLGGACDSLTDAFEAETSSPLILAAVFTIDFLCIRPFDEGNGRIARLFADLILAKAGFDVARYMSVDRIIERSGMDYYNALNACVEGWDRSKGDYAPYVVYWLDVLHEAYQALIEKLESQIDAPGGKAQRVRAFVKDAADPVTKRQVREAFPDISESTIENVLGDMVRNGEVEKVGAGRSTAYR